MGNKDSNPEFEYFVNSATTYMNEDTIDYDDNFIIHHNNIIPPVLTLLIGWSIRYIQDNHVEVGKIVGVDVGNTFKPTRNEVEFDNSRKV